MHVWRWPQAHLIVLAKHQMAVWARKGGRCCPPAAGSEPCQFNGVTSRVWSRWAGSVHTPRSHVIGRLIRGWDGLVAPQATGATCPGLLAHTAVWHHSEKKQRIFPVSFVFLHVSALIPRIIFLLFTLVQEFSVLFRILSYCAKYEIRREIPDAVQIMKKKHGNSKFFL